MERLRAGPTQGVASGEWEAPAGAGSPSGQGRKLCEALISQGLREGPGDLTRVGSGLRVLKSSPFTAAAVLPPNLRGGWSGSFQDSRKGEMRGVGWGWGGGGVGGWSSRPPRAQWETEKLREAGANKLASSCRFLAPRGGWRRRLSRAALLATLTALPTPASRVSGEPPLPPSRGLSHHSLQQDKEEAREGLQGREPALPGGIGDQPLRLPARSCGLGDATTC